MSHFKKKVMDQAANEGPQGPDSAQPHHSPEDVANNSELSKRCHFGWRVRCRWLDPPSHISAVNGCPCNCHQRCTNFMYHVPAPSTIITVPVVTRSLDTMEIFLNVFTEFSDKQECIPVGFVQPACCPYLPACTALGVSAPGGGGWLLLEGCAPRGVYPSMQWGRPPLVNRILDASFWKYYLAPTSLRAVKICHCSKKDRTCHLLCKRPGCYHSASKTHVRASILKLTPNSFINFPEFTESSAPFRKDSNEIQTYSMHVVQCISDGDGDEHGDGTCKRIFNIAPSYFIIYNKITQERDHFVLRD